jgi:hypothetical protein
VWAGGLEFPGRPAQPLEFSISATDQGLFGQRSARGGRASTSLEDLAYERRQLRFSYIEGGARWTFQGVLQGDTIEGSVQGPGGSGRLVLKLAR